MIGLPTRLKVFVTLAPTDMRKSFSGLIGIVEKELSQQLEAGDLFLFFNRPRNRLKVLFFTPDGAVILYKRLERGTFEMLREPNRRDAAQPPPNHLTLRAEELQLLLDGIELRLCSGGGANDTRSRPTSRCCFPSSRSPTGNPRRRLLPKLRRSRRNRRRRVVRAGRNGSGSSFRGSCGI